MIEKVLRLEGLLQNGLFKENEALKNEITQIKNNVSIIIKDFEARSSECEELKGKMQNMLQGNCMQEKQKFQQQ